MFKFLMLVLCVSVFASAADLPSKKYLNLAAIKAMVAGAEAEAQRQNVQVTICIVDESGKGLCRVPHFSRTLREVGYVHGGSAHVVFTVAY